MNILMLAYEFRPDLGGIADYSHNLARGISLKGHSVMVACGSECAKGPYRTVSVKSPASRSPLAYVRSFFYFLRLIRDNSIDAVFLSYLSYYHSGPYLLMLACLAAGRPLYLFVYALELDDGGRSKKKIKRWMAFNFARKIFAISEYTRKLAGRFTNGKKEIVIARPCVDIAMLEEAAEQARQMISERYSLRGKKVLLTLGRLVERKGMDSVIRVMPELVKRFPELIYIVAGEGPERDSLRSMVSRLGMEDHVIFTGVVTEKEKKGLLKSCDVFVMPCRGLSDYDAEGFGIVFAEAAVFNKPSVAGRSGGAPEVVLDGISGFTVDPLDPEQLAEKLLFLLGNPRKARAMGARGRLFVERRLTPESLSESVLSALQGQTVKREKDRFCF
ncbi:MAG: glycosyltransferase [Candidatus Omnitrophica bacterium]|nr:glycosyltransferase [Candidatus Omnitrophota bacterium]